MNDTASTVTNARILVVEDELIIGRIIQKRLQALGYDAPEVVVSGEDAIVKALAMRPDLVLMDIRLAGKIDGVAAAMQIRSRVDVPVIYLTAYADADTLRRAKVTEPFGYIIKPFEERDLLTAIEMALYKHQMELRLKRSEQWLATTLNSINDAVIATDVQGLVTYLNPVAEALTGWEKADALGLALARVFSLVNEKSGDSLGDPVAMVVRDRTPAVLDAGPVLVARDGLRIPVEASASPIVGGDGSLLGVVLVFRDVTEKRKMVDDLLKAQKLESIGLLAGGIAHDFNNLLTVALGNVSLAQALTSRHDRIWDRLAAVEHACLRARDLTQQLLTFSKGGAPVRKTTSIADLIRESVCFTLSGKKVGCEFSIPDDLWPADVDEGQISQVMHNLVLNADQAMPRGGMIRIVCENASMTGGNDNQPRDEKFIRIMVADTGPGISEDNLSRIFDPYFTTKDDGKGLGLATVYSIVKNHGGHISVESRPGHGTTFILCLPASADCAPETRADEPGIVDGKGRILVMDDEENIREVAGEILRHLGYDVESVADGAEAVELYREARESSRPFSAVLMDLTVPGGMGGREAMSILREIDSGVRAIVSSGYSNDPIMADYRRYGFRGVITKPYKVAELGRVLNEVVENGG